MGSRSAKNLCSSCRIDSVSALKKNPAKFSQIMLFLCYKSISFTALIYQLGAIFLERTHGSFARVARAILGRHALEKVYAIFVQKKSLCYKSTETKANLFWSFCRTTEFF
jgi:hypothetical protein